MASRPIKDQEAAALSYAGDMRAAGAEHTVAMDGLAILVHPSNPVNQLSTEQIAKIFSGQLSNWAGRRR